MQVPFTSFFTYQLADKGELNWLKNNSDFRAFWLVLSTVQAKPEHKNENLPCLLTTNNQSCEEYRNLISFNFIHMKNDKQPH